jgi:hypothetical protein
MKANKPKSTSSRRTKDPETRPNTRGLILHTARSAPADQLQTAEPPAARRVPAQIDPGIRKAVELFQKYGVETFEACEGGVGHSYPEPTVAFYGGPAAGHRAVAVCLDYGMPVLSLKRVWDILETNELTGPHWEITFRRRMV